MAPVSQTFTETPNLKTNDVGERVVIAGMSGLYPNSHNVNDLSNILYNKINPISAENSRWEYDHPEVAQYTGKVPELKKFDAQFFKVHYRLGNNMDAMGRKILEKAYEAIYDAGISPSELNGKKVGVYVGSCFSETEKACFYVSSTRTGFGIAGCSKSMFANRVSYWLNAKGPSMAVDEACISSTGALELAYLAITRGECEAAIVGGANLCLHPQSSIHYGRIMKLSMDGNTKSFNTDASGCAKSEAINVLFLQKAKDALRVYAEVVHVKCEFNSILEDESGPRYGFYRNPSVVSDFIKRFYEEAKVAPEAVEYVEAFGSAVTEADKAELEAIEEVFCKNRTEPLLIGSVMSNIGYGEAASGISAITKVLLGYHTGKLAANLHCDSPRQDISALRDGRMRVVTAHKEFKRAYTAVNSLSVTGVNAHVLLNGHYKPKDPLRYKTNIPQLVTISGRQDSSVKKILSDLISRPIDHEELALFRNIHKTSVFGHMGRGFIILDTDENNETVALRQKADYFDDVKRQLWFVYSGMGSQWAGMGSQLMRIPIFAAAIERCRIALEPKGIDIVHIITSPNKTIFDNILHSFVGIAAIQIGLTDVLSALGIFPDKIIGHSVGELGCAYADGCFTAEEMILSAYSRGLVSLQTPFIKGSMAAVGIGYQQISSMCPPEIEVACHNGPDSSTISGPAEAMKEFVAHLTSKEIFAKEVPCSNIPYHSRYIAEAGPSLLKYLNEVIKAPKPRSERWVSTSVPQDRWDEPLAKYSSAEYHTNNLLNPVLFEETSTLIPANAVLIEIAPHGLLQAILKRSLPISCKHVPLTRRGHPDNAQFLLEAIGMLYIEGFNPKVEALYPKVEYPVSTGTPMLSHLVEWAHNERWIIPLYVSARRKTAAACKYVVSTHDDESVYLKGHIIREKNIYPFAAVLVAIWDTLAMVLGVAKKQLSVEFKDVHHYSQLPLHDQRQLRLNVALHRGTGKFEVLGENIKVATGYITAVEPKATIDTKCTEDMSLTSEDIYHLLSAKEYNYTGDFRSIYNTNFSKSEANIIWNNNWVTLIDGMLQLNMLRREHSTVSQPQLIEKITIDVNRHLDDAKLLENGLNVMSAKINKVQNTTSCGGVVIKNIIFNDLLPLNKNIELKSLQFVPHVTKDKLDKTSALYAMLQVVAENLNKTDLNIFQIGSNKVNDTDYKEIEQIFDNLPGINVTYTIISIDDVLKQRDSFIDVDLLLVKNLSVDGKLSQMMRQVCNFDSFLINTENIGRLLNTSMSSLYYSVCSHTISSIRLELALWRPTNLQGVWGGEYYIPVLENPVKGKRMVLAIKQFGDLESLHWIETPESNDPGIDVTVHYAGLNDVEIKKKQGVLSFDKNTSSSLLDYSGTTKNGVRVMGITYDKSIKTCIKARPELIWPVPEHWSLEDAATVPLAYSLAFYCLCVKGRYKAGLTVLVHGGTGALGQAVISIALAHGSRVFATVSDNKKKQFLRKMFPELKDDHILNSRDISFADTVMNNTNGCDVIVSCVRGDIKHATMKCCHLSGTVVDTSVLINRERYDLGMKFLKSGASYYSVDLFSILDLENEEIKQIQIMISDGISHGYVRPLSRVTLPPQQVARAYRLQASSRHRGRVLISLQEDSSYVQSNMICSSKQCHLLVLGNEALGLQLADRLVARGARTIGLVISKLSTYIKYKLRTWGMEGVNVVVINQNDWYKTNTTDIYDFNENLIDIEGIYYVHSAEEEMDITNYTLKKLIAIGERISKLKYFTVISNNNDLKHIITSEKFEHKLKWISIPTTDVNGLSKEKTAISIPTAVDAIEKAMCSNESDVVIHLRKRSSKISLLKELASAAGINITHDVPQEVTLKDLGIDPAKFETIRVYLRDVYNISLDDDNVQFLTVKKIDDLEDILSDNYYEETEGLKTFISYIDYDELLATTEMVFLPTLTNLSAKREAEFDVNQTYLCIVPGVEGHHARFQTLCERLKLPALVLQPGLDRMNESVTETAHRYSQILLEKTKLKNGFFLMAYESGILIALEMVAILEDQGLTGTVFCIGGGPEEIQATFEDKLEELNTEEKLQNAVIRHMFTLMTNDDKTKLDTLDVCIKSLTWNEKVTECVKMLRGRVEHSNQYTKLLIQSAYARIIQVRRYTSEQRKLRSKLISIRPVLKSVSCLQNYSLQPIVEYNLDVPLAFVAQDLRCSAIVNRYLDSNILELFDTKIVCETYVLSTDTFLTSANDFIACED